MFAVNSERTAHLQRCLAVSSFSLLKLELSSEQVLAGVYAVGLTSWANEGGLSWAIRSYRKKL
jgi:hypothetical protein